MKPEEASQVIKDSYIPKMFTALEEALEVAIQALEKQVPKKVSFSGEYLCGNCNATINSEDCYCYNCGQRQDWGEIDET